MRNISKYVVALSLSLSLVGCMVDEQAPASEALAEELGEASLACDLAADELGRLSCELGMPVNEEGFTPEDLGHPVDDGEDFSAAACNTYYGACTSWSGCSRAQGEGWSFTQCGSWLYAYLTVCDGHASSWGYSPCLF